MPNPRLILVLACCTVLAFAACVNAAPDVPDLPEKPVVEKLEVTAEAAVFDDASRNRPLELTSADQAKAYFSEAQLAALNGMVDWDSQRVLVFAWRGSGQDKLATDVEQGDDGPSVKFIYTPGLTRDLRPHVYIFAIQNGVEWTGPETRRRG